MRPRWSVVLLLLVMLGFGIGWMMSPPVSHSQTLYGPDDTLAAIDEASAEIGVSRAWLYQIVRCETGNKFDPYAIGKQGELGAAQLHPHGELPRFYAWGYTDPFSPYQGVRFLAQRLAQGGSSAWSCA